MTERFQQFTQKIIWLLVILGVLSLIIYGASIYIQPTTIETITTQSTALSTAKTDDVQFHKTRNRPHKN